MPTSFFGMLRDRIDMVKEGWRDVVSQAQEEANKKYGGAVYKYETDREGPADRNARKAGMVEKLK
jgi:hypothetical protein